MELIFGLITLIILIFSAILHEVAHGYVAERFGDPTARLAGRLTLNPKKHIDPFMSILLPLALMLSSSPVIFGAAKPVPIDPFNLKEGRKDIALVALSGPLTNIILAVLASIVIHVLNVILPATNITLSILHWFFLTTVHLNLLLAIFNLIPIPSLDGSKVFALLLPRELANAYLSLSSIGFILILFLLMFHAGPFSLGNIMFNLLTFSEKLLGI
jgi:Zn-dependent protease